ncbi:DNA polymerase III subunit alpha [Candidatus Profftella armatura]|uniref:DNA polymerase III subunit alpha n=1 Tax=Candidatus Profftella armatura TaxID=669502 RepID=UPI0015DC988F|nr:DNA polymerase III subunit alpha [Candidatus Profftella armatura]QLK13887.1 DNA polymerase III subunit alpha [Candidatus Profftella armatura]
MIPQFIHLRLHSEYSIIDGLLRINDVIEAAANDYQPALAITDLSNLFGIIKFYKSAYNKGIKPIIGCDVWITNEIENKKPSRLLLLVKNNNGYLQLCELLSKAYIENINYGRAEIRIEWLEKNKYQDGLIALSGAHLGDIGIAVQNGRNDIAENFARRWSKIFPDNFYIEIQRFKQPNMNFQIQQFINIASNINLPIVATHPIQFLKKTEFLAHEVRTCIAEGEILSNTKRIKKFTKEQNFKTQSEMIKLFYDIPSAIQNTIEIAKRCNLKLEFGKPKLPKFPTPKNININDFLISKSKHGLKKRLLNLYKDPEIYKCEKLRYKKRLQFEIETIIKMNFSGYFLIVSDFIQWAKNNSIPVGPGRGSGASSLVAYSLSITDIDPLSYNLLFERFLNPNRISMPDFDIDFCPEGRDRVIQYVKDRYGKDAVSQIVTFGTMAAKGAIRDVGRVLDLRYSFCDSISKLIPFKPGKLITLSNAIKEEPQLAERIKNEEEVRQLIELAKQVEGIIRNVGMHAGGVLIAPSKLINFCPLYKQEGMTGIISQYDKDDIEEIGLIKFDFLGLTTLSILDKTIYFIKKINTKTTNFSLNKLPLNDKDTYNLLKKANTVAVFQLESQGMKNMLKEAKPDYFEEIIALISLYRPGPMDLIKNFCRRKHGEYFNYPDPRTKDVLSETYGIMVYQEQVMQIAQILGGYSLGQADLLRRAIGKKKTSEMIEHRKFFQNGAIKYGLSKHKANEIFNEIEKFAGYGFNKSHATAYALLSYYTAYLKTHYSSFFMAANLSLSMDDTNKIKILVKDAIKTCGLSILPPNINLSKYYFFPIIESDGKHKKIRYGLGAIKGTGKSTIEAIVTERKFGFFTNLFDFTKRIDKKYINRRIINSLINSGAFDCFNEKRYMLVASIDVALKNAEKTKKFINQLSLFKNDDNNNLKEYLNYVKVPSWSKKQELIEEKKVLGFCLSEHIFCIYETEIRQFIPIYLSELKPTYSCTVSGIITELKLKTTYRGKILIIVIDDNSNSVEVIINNQLYEKNKNILKENELLIVSGKVLEDRFLKNIRINAEKIFDINVARILYGKKFSVMFNRTFNISILKKILLRFKCKNGLPFVLYYCINKSIKYEMKFPLNYKVQPIDDLKLALINLGLYNAIIEYS